MVPSGLQLPSQRRDADGHILTHGFVHGHVHQHKDHVHIHGHIHNHDHVEKNNENVVCGGAGMATSNRTAAKEETSSELGCKELENSFDLCSDIFCDDLDDCYYYDCDRPGPGAPGLETGTNIAQNDIFGTSGSGHSNICETGHCEELEAAAAECCEDENCLVDPAQDICTDTGCIDTDHHGNSLCDLQKPRLNIFEDLIQNVHRNIEQYAGFSGGSGPQIQANLQGFSNVSGDVPGTGSVTQNDSIAESGAGNPRNDFHIHFPHHCHQEHSEQGEALHGGLDTPAPPVSKSNPLLPNAHTMHQSCFHARIPTPYMPKAPFDEVYKNSKPEPQQYHNDYDFFVQFNNFKQIFPENTHAHLHENSPEILSENAQKHQTLNTPQFPEHLHQPHTFSCQWENCLQSVDNGSLLTHLLGSHLGQEAKSEEHRKPAQIKLECEWDDCGFVDENLQSFMDHLNTHKTDEYTHNGVSPLLTPRSIETISESPDLTHTTSKSDVPAKKRKICKTGDCVNPQNDVAHRHALSISEMRILPKKPHQNEPLDPSHSCKWQTGTDPKTGEAIICNKQHLSDGDLQEHLKTAHIGKGKSIYHCCWVGCERNHGKPFTQRQKLFRHIHIHTGHKPCTCEVCGASFAVPSMLKQHSRVHSGEKPYKCHECGRAFATSSSLAIHTRVHTDSRPLECTWPGCQKRFRESSNLAKHLRTHSTKYRCEACGEQFDKKREFTKHRKSHVGEVEVRGEGETEGVEEAKKVPELTYSGSALQT